MKKIHFENPVEFRNLERDAYYGVLEYEKFPSAEYKYFDTITKLSYQYRHEGLPKELFLEHKTAAYKEYITEKDILDSRLHYAKLCHEKILIENSTRSKINKSTNYKEMLKLALQYIEVATGEQGFAKRNLNKLKSEDK